MEEQQLGLPLDSLPAGVELSLLSPRELWVLLSAEFIDRLSEDRRIEFKSARAFKTDQLAEYYSMYSNTPEGGVLLIGVENDGRLTGCAQLNTDKLNSIETFHLHKCPDAKPEFRRIALDRRHGFFIAVYLPLFRII